MKGGKSEIFNPGAKDGVRMRVHNDDQYVSDDLSLDIFSVVLGFKAGRLIV